MSSAHLIAFAASKFSYEELFEFDMMNLLRRMNPVKYKMDHPPRVEGEPLPNPRNMNYPAEPYKAPPHGHPWLYHPFHAPDPFGQLWPGGVDVA